MKRIPFLLIPLFVILSIFFFQSVTLPQSKSTTWEVYFSPKGGCTEAIIKGLDKAK